MQRKSGALTVVVQPAPLCFRYLRVSNAESRQTDLGFTT
jgi:hypothetical protein